MNGKRPKEDKEANHNHADENGTNGVTGERETKQDFEDDTNFLQDRETEVLMKSELLEVIQLLKNAKVSLELLKENYTKRNKDEIDGTENLNFSSMKKLYGEKIVEFGGLAEKHRKIKNEVKSFHKSNANLRGELDQMRGPKVQDNP